MYACGINWFWPVTGVSERMKYCDDQEIMLGDIVELSMPKGSNIAKVVMLEETYLHLMLEDTNTGAEALLRNR